ncbi:MAG: dockerin type I domain-containing protein, partial [Planctomycetota bacterium]
MKSLRQLLRLRTTESSVEPARKRRDKRRQGGETRRRLSTQALEQRQLLAGDVVGATNSINQYDVNQDFKISPSDALSVINFLAATHATAGEGESSASGSSEISFAGRKVDVNGDGQVTPNDALQVINALGRGEAMDPLIELMLTARDEADNELVPNSSGVIEVDTGIDNSFFIEVSYTDLRANPLGLFTIFPDIGTSQGNALQPVMR